jgi:RHS repeat-associated protein
LEKGDPASDLGGYRYTAFGRTVTAPDTSAPTVFTYLYQQPLRWQGRWYTEMAGGLYDFRSRVWSPELGAFLMPDEFGFLTRTGTLWSWPGQNPYRWRDPSGMEGMSVGKAVAIGIGAYLGGTWGFSVGVAASGGATLASGGAAAPSVPPAAIAGAGLGAAGGAIAGGMAYDLLSSATQALGNSIQELLDSPMLARKADQAQIDWIVKKYGLSREQRQRLHRLISKKGMTLQEIEEIAQELAEDAARAGRGGSCPEKK